MNKMKRRQVQEKIQCYCINFNLSVSHNIFLTVKISTFNAHRWIKKFLVFSGIKMTMLPAETRVRRGQRERLCTTFEASWNRLTHVSLLQLATKKTCFAISSHKVSNWMVDNPKVFVETRETSISLNIVYVKKYAVYE